MNIFDKIKSFFSGSNSAHNLPAPTRFDPYEFYSADRHGKDILLDSMTGSKSKAASSAIEYARSNPDYNISLRWEYTTVPVQSDDQIGDITDRLDKQAAENRQKYLNSPEGKIETARYAAEHEARMERKAKAKILSTELIAKSTFKFPDDTPSISGYSSESEQMIKESISIGAQWLKDNPNKKPLSNKADMKELEAFIGNVDHRGHSGASFGLVMTALENVAANGFENLVEGIKKSHQQSASRG